MKLKRCLGILLIFTMMLSVVSCGKNKKKAMTVGDSTLSSAILRYYAYNSQASYENYYKAVGSEIDWNKDMDGKTLEGKVKDNVLLDIRRRYSLINHAEDFGVSTSDISDQVVESMIEDYKKDTLAELRDKVDAKDKDLKAIFRAYLIYDEICENIKSANAITIEEADFRQVAIKLIEITEEDVDKEYLVEGTEGMALAIAEKLGVNEAGKEDSEPLKVKDGEMEKVASEIGLTVTEGTIGLGDRKGDAIEKACLTLKTGEVTVVSENEKSYVIYCVNENDEQASEVIAEDKLKEIVDSYIDEYVEKYNEKITLDQKIWDDIKFKEPIIK